MTITGVFQPYYWELLSKASLNKPQFISEATPSSKRQGEVNALEDKGHHMAQTVMTVQRATSSAAARGREVISAAALVGAARSRSPTKRQSCTCPPTIASLPRHLPRTRMWRCGGAHLCVDNHIYLAWLRLATRMATLQMLARGCCPVWLLCLVTLSGYVPCLVILSRFAIPV